MTQSPNVLLVVLDSVRASNTSIHGHRHDTTPALTSLASKATTYTQARAPDRWSLPSHASLFTGLTSPEHEVTKKGDQLAAGHSVFATLHEAGYATGLFSENPFLTEIETGLDDGFETVEGTATKPLYPSAADPHKFTGDHVGFLQETVKSGRPVRSILNGVMTKLVWDYPHFLPDSVTRRVSGGESRGENYTDLFLKWMTEQDRPWAACINYMDAHHPYVPRPEYNHWADKSVESVLDRISPYPGGFYSEPESMWRCEVAEFLYDGVIRQVDHEIDRLVDEMRRQGEFEDTLVVVTGDHGDGFGEVSRLRPIRIAGHAVGAHETNLHVPLVVKYPDQQDSQYVTDPVSLTGFPDAVRAARNDNWKTSDPFMVEEPIIAVGSQPDADFLNRIATTDRNTSPFQGDVQVVYEPTEDGAVRKHMRWGEEQATVTVVDAHTVIPTDKGGNGTVEAVFDSLHPQGVAENGSFDEIDDTTKQRLMELGYR